MGAAHARGVLHRDLKPSNIMVDGRGQVRIMDFGLAVAVTDDVREVAGTRAYMSPEQFAGGPVTVRSDLYSLGRVLDEILPAGARAVGRGYRSDLHGVGPGESDQAPRMKSQLRCRVLIRSP